MACVEECISERESRQFELGLNTKVNLDIYKWFGESVEFKKYLHGVLLYEMQEADFCLCLGQVCMI